MDIDPTEKQEADRAEHYDPSTAAINTVRGVALGAVLSYALWVARHTEVEHRSWENLELTEVREVLEERFANDPSTAIHSIFGKWFSYIFWLDEEWTNAHVDSIFPQADGREAFRHAAWDAYLMFSRTVFLDSFDLLRASFEQALAEMGPRDSEKTRTGDPDERLGGHLMLFYRGGVLKIGDPLLENYFGHAEAKHRHSVMVAAVRQIQEITDDRREAVVNRLKELWEWRCPAAINESGVELHELSAFSWWFLKDVFSPEWRLEQLRTTQLRGIRLQLGGRVLEKLVELAPSLPSKVLDCLNAIVRNSENRTCGIYDDHVKEILRIALNASDRGLQDNARELVDYIGSLGFRSFRKLIGK